MSADPGTNELLEVAFRFGSAVVAMATSAAPPDRRLIEAWHHLEPVEGALSGLWPEPHVPIELVGQIRQLLDRLAPDGSPETAIAAMDERAITRTGQQITSLAFALHQTVGATETR